MKLKLCLAFVLASPLILASQPTFPPVALTAPDVVDSDFFGFSVAVDGNLAVVGAPQEDAGGDVPPSSMGQRRPGKVYVFLWSGANWIKEAELTASDGATGDAFGLAVAVSGGTVAVGAPFKNNRAGAVYVFSGSGSVWTQQTKLTAGDAQSGATFGSSVALSGTTLVIGAPGQDAFVGTGYVFSQQNGMWVQQSELGASDAAPAPQFGFSVAVDGSTIAIGSPGFQSEGSPGKAYVFTPSASGNWTQAAELVGSDSAGGDFFGASVSVSAGTVVVGDSGQHSLAGAAYVFAPSGASWTQQAKLTAQDPSSEFQFGRLVAISGGMVAIASSHKDGTETVVVFTGSGNNWTELCELTVLNTALAVSGSTLLVGAPGPLGLSPGAAYGFQISNVTLLSNPPGRTFELTGAGCVTPGQFTTPYAGLWTNCSVQWISPDTGTLGALYTFENWWDQTLDNPRTFSLDPGEQTTISADFSAEYQLLVQSLPAGVGQISGGGFYPAGTTAIVSAVPEEGTVFAGWGGALSGQANPQSLLMNGPKTVIANFAATPVSGVNAAVSARSGPSAERTWTITISNTGSSNAYNAQLAGLMLTQTFGPKCTVPPIRISPAAFPILLGNIAGGATTQTSVVLDFSGCPLSARFTTTLVEVSNGGSSVGITQLLGQFQ